MRLQDNPFYILNVSFWADKRTILSAAEKKTFSLDAEKCIEAQNILLNSSKRLSAEMGWFPIVDTQMIELVQKNIHHSLPISTDWFSPLCKLNALVYNFSITTTTQERDNLALIDENIEGDILRIDQQFSLLNPNDIAHTINQYRIAANFPEITPQNVVNEINNIRVSIKKTITQKLSQLDLSAYVGIVTRIADKYINSTCNNSVILIDIIKEYEIKLQSRLETEVRDIETRIAQIKELDNENEINKNIKALIKEVKNWDYFAQPIQLTARASGISHVMSEKVGKQLRSLAIYLNNEKDFPQQALELVNAMKTIFAELGILTEALNIDSQTLQNNVASKNAKDEENRVLKQVDDIKIQGETVVSSPTLEKIDTFIAKVEELDNAIKAMNTVSTFKRAQMREKLCLTAREVARDLYRSNTTNIKYAYKIVLDLQSRFSDTTLSNKLSVDVSQLNTIIERNNETYRKQKKEKERREKMKKTWRVLLILLIIGAIVYWAVNNANKPQSVAGTSNKSNTYTSSKTNTSVPTSTPKPVLVYNGTKLITPEYEEVCPFEVIADSTTDYYIYLKYMRAPTSTTVNRSKKTKATSPYEGDIAFYLKAGQTVSIDVPIGVYKLYYATGSTFFGTKLLFGDKTKCYASDDLLTFYADNEYYRGHTITLKTVYNGNFDTDPISEYLFPTR